MKFVMTKTFAAAALSLLVVAGCGNRSDGAGDARRESAAGHPSPAAAQAGLNITATAPDGWYRMPVDTTQAMMEQGANVVAGDNQQLQAAARAAAQTTIQLFGYMRVPPGSPTNENPSVVGMAENVKAAPGVQRGRDYFFQVQRLWEQSTMDVHVLGNDQTRQIDGHPFDRIDVKVNAMGREIFQSYYAARRNDHMIVFIQSWQSDGEKTQTDGIVDSIKLNW
jgi:hypothetical protein